MESAAAKLLTVVCTFFATIWTLS